jgi:hypothetical protein
MDTPTRTGLIEYNSWYSHLKGGNDALWAVVPGPAMRPVQDWLPA